MNRQTTSISKSAHNNVSSSNLEVHLTGFVQKSLAESYSQDIDANLQLLDRAWEAQKLLWQLRGDGSEKSGQ
ncbi:hypothetical protein [Microcoleus sp. F4-D5]|uniref:hypothetical protein n=1 Tax=Microcoleus sp. F4-D5 TaxID=2818760 RepID=UPI002FD4DCED